MAHLTPACRAEEVRETFEKFGELRWGLLQLHDTVQVLLLSQHIHPCCAGTFICQKVRTRTALCKRACLFYCLFPTWSTAC